ncbi:DNA repair protein RadC [Neobacillus niacini]|jgi:DNA repair protein RadC|nr:DNA repair protein RadC [Neobacillus niacini]
MIPFLHLLREAAQVSAMVAHNHPSGNPNPSREDIDFTKRLSEFGKIVGIEVLDHIIIGTTYYSLKDKGHM